MPFVLLVGRYRVQNVERIPTSGPFIMVANHITDFDPLVTAYTLWHHGRVPHYLAKASLFSAPVVGWAFRSTGQVAVERATRGHAGTIAQGERLIDEGLALVIYPEGTLTRDPDLWPMRGKSGAVRIALETGVPLIPSAHWGAQNILPRWSKRFRLFPRKTVDIVIGEPLDLSRWKGKPLDAATLNEATLHVMQAITSLLESLRGETAPAERWDPAAHGQTEFGRIVEPKKKKRAKRTKPAA
ncbi:MAG: lysophospholipid acyltransferase family protein [Pseudolysinimonas sp.]